MIEIARNRRLGFDTQQVWATLSDFGAIACWAPNVDHSTLLNDRTDAVGMQRRIQAGRATLVETVVEWTNPTTLAYSIDGLPPILGSVTNRWVIEPANYGSLVTLTSQIEPGPRPGRRLAALVARRPMASASESLLAGLDSHLARLVGL